MDAEPIAPGAPDATPNEVDVIRVLLIDDDSDDRLIIEDLLNEVADTRYELTWIDQADAGAQALRSVDYDVCLLDYRLGDQTGLDVLAAVADLPTRVPCIMLTGIEDEATDRKSTAAGAVDYLIKQGLTSAELERAIRYTVVTARNARSIRDSEQRFRLIFEASQEGIAVFDKCGGLERANPATLQMFGLHSVEGLTFRDLIADTEVEPISKQFRNWPHGTPIALREIATIGRRSDGTTFPLEVSISSFCQAGERHWGAVLRDTSRTTELLDQLTHQTLHDRLTGVGNRTLLRDRVSQSVRLADLAGTRPALLILDLDDFKRVNDVYGHDTGDRVLIAAADRLGGELRVGETLARVGSDEFAVLVDGRDTHGVIRLAERLRQAIARPFDIAGEIITISASVGVALVDDTDTTADEAIRNADVAMYEAKAKGKDRVEVFEEKMYGDLLDLIVLEHDLRAAIDSDEIDVHFQPIVDIETGDVVTVEALARWHHEDRGWVQPDVFIAAAERSGAIDALGTVVLDRALKELTRLQPLGISMAVNVSSHQLGDDSFVDTVARLLEDYDVNGHFLVIEVTETVLLGSVDNAVRRLQSLRQLGVRIALDDFGTGYSSLSYLRRLPIDELKLDRSFVRNVDCPRVRALIDAVAGIADAFGIPCIAEGIESEHERRLLGSLGFDRAQGYHFARPMTGEELIARLDGDRRLDGPSA